MRVPLFPLTGKGGLNITRAMALPRSGGVDFVKGGVLSILVRCSRGMERCPSG